MQFNYRQLVWMYHDRTNNNEINLSMKDVLA